MMIVKGWRVGKGRIGKVVCNLLAVWIGKETQQPPLSLLFLD